jgi:hypothetical protein
LRAALAAVAAARKPPPDTLYVHNARLHRLRTTRVAVRGADATVDLEAVNLDKGTRTPFAVVIPLSGQDAAVPSRITLQPRWWLRLRLDLAEVRR